MLDKVEAGERRDLWKEYAVAGTPTLVFMKADGSREVILQGLKKPTGLEEALRRLRAGDEKKNPPQKEELHP